MPQTALVLDDDELCRVLLSEILKEKNIEVSAYSDPAEFFAAQEQQRVRTAFDYVITDNQMPGMNGIEFLQILKQLDGTPPDSCLAIVSGSWNSTDLDCAKKLGCRIFSKPFQLTQLHEWIDS